MQTLRSRRQINSVPWIFLATVAAIACHPQIALAATKVITDAGKGGEVHLQARDQLELRLRSNPSTGYMWYVEKESTPLLKLAHQSQTDAPDQSSDQSSEQTVGRPVYQVFKFEPRRAGDGILRMHYVRSWEKPTPDDEQFQIHVVIE